MKIERKHAKRLATYLEDDMGWEVYPEDKFECPNRHSQWRGPYCSDCGQKMKKVKQEDTVAELVKAIEFALEK